MRRLSLIATALMLGACQLQGPGTPKPAAPLATRPAGVRASLPPTIPTVPSTGTGGAPIISDNGASLIGKVKGPAQILGNNGSSLVGPGGYATLAVDQVPLAGATVRLLDAAGNPVKDAQGLPLTATTDANGHYGFTAALPAQNLVVEVALAGDKGALQAVVAKNGGHQVDVDLISTLSTGYVLGKYVTDKASAVATFEKLPAAVEQETRKKTASAFEAAGTVPDTLTPAAVLAEVEVLRQKDRALDAQFEVVRKLLIAAGVSDLGNGKPGLQVRFSSLQGVAPAADGSVYVLSAEDRRVWRLKPDGILETAIGSGGSATAAPAGMAGPEVGLSGPQAIALDGQGRLLVQEDQRLLRLEADGKVSVVATTPYGRFLVPVEADAALLVSDERRNQLTVHRIENGTARLLTSFELNPPKTPYREERRLLGCADGGSGAMTLLIYDGKTGAHELHRLELGTGALTRQQSFERSVSMDGRGNLFSRNDAEVLEVRAAGQDTWVPQGDQPAPHLAAATLDAAGRAVLTSGARVFRFEGGRLQAIAGLEGLSELGSATGFFFKDLSGVAADPKGGFYVADRGFRRVFHVDGDDQLSFAAGAEPGAKASGVVKNGVAADAVRLSSPSFPKLGPTGEVHFVTGLAMFGHVLRLEGAGTLQIAAQLTGDPDDPVFTKDMAVGPDGAVYVANLAFLDSDGGQLFEGEVLRLHPQTPTSLFKTERSPTMTLPPGVDPDDMPDFDRAQHVLGLAIAPDGALIAAGNGKLRRWKEGEGLSELYAHADLQIGGSCGLAIDRAGRYYITSESTNQILRFDPATRALTVLAGEGGAHFKGTGVDDSLHGPASPTFDRNGHLLFVDQGSRQVKRILADAL